MELISVHFRNFLKHEDRTVEFEPGMNALRGRNEAGKSSILEGIGYLINGAAALEKTVDDTVNWNAKNKASMKVSALFRHAGGEYRAVRGPSGAEVYKAGSEVPVCTGQKECTEYLENLLGLPPGRAYHTMFANQNAIRGVLALGPTAASEFIEKLADFTEIDGLISRIARDLPNGSTKLLEDRLAAAADRLANHAIPEVPDISAAGDKLIFDITAAKTLAKECRAEHAGQSAASERHLFVRKRVTKDLETAMAARSQKQLELNNLRKTLEQVTTAKAVAAEFDAALLKEAAYQEYQSFCELQKELQAADAWEGDLQALAKEIGLTKAKIAELTAGTQQAHADIKALKKQLIPASATICPTCGTELKDPKMAELHNLQINTHIAARQQDILNFETTVKENQSYLGSLEKALGLFEKADPWAQDLRVQADHSTVPPQLIWGWDIPDKVSAQPLLKEAERCRKLLEAAAGSDTKIRLYEEAVATITEREASLQVELSQIPDVTVDSTLVTKAEALEKEVRELQEELTALRLTESTAKTAAAVAVNEKARLTAEVTSAEQAIKAQNENNVFIKTLKEARILVAEKLWSTIMQGVSNYFSRLRGVPSVVARTPNGFSVDGKMSRPSGSTLDILGLALRIVVAKLFTGAGLLVLDEASAGCDNERTLNMASVVQAAGFEQIIWATHDDVVEIGAANLIEL